MLYTEFCGIVRNEMLQKLPNRFEINSKFGLDNKRRRIRRPWLNESLAAKWNKNELVKILQKKADSESKACPKRQRER